MEKVLQEIQEGKYRLGPVAKRLAGNITDILLEPPKRSKNEQKKAWYKISKVLLRKHKLPLHAESKVGARRTYRYYTIGKGNWLGPSCRQFSKMTKYKFEIELS